MPLRQRVDSWLRRIVTNLIRAAPSFLVLRLLLIPFVIAAATWAQAREFGLLRLVQLSPVVATMGSISILDYVMYGWH